MPDNRLGVSLKSTVLTWKLPLTEEPETSGTRLQQCVLTPRKPGGRGRRGCVARQHGKVDGMALKRLVESELGWSELGGAS